MGATFSSVFGGALAVIAALAIYEIFIDIILIIAICIVWHYVKKVARRTGWYVPRHYHYHYRRKKSKRK